MKHEHRVGMARRSTLVIAFVAIVAAALVIRDPGPAARDAGAPSPTSSPASEQPEDVSLEEFCAAFERLAATHGNHLANNTSGSMAELQAAGKTVLDLEPGTPMPPPAREGLVWFVDGVLGQESDPVPPESSAAFTSFLEAACRPGN